MKTRSFDLKVIHNLLISAFIVSFLITFWFIFDATRSYQQIDISIEEYVIKSSFNGKRVDIIYDQFFAKLIDQSMKFGFVILMLKLYLNFNFRVSYFKTHFDLLDIHNRITVWLHCERCRPLFVDRLICHYNHRRIDCQFIRANIISSSNRCNH